MNGKLGGEVVLAESHVANIWPPLPIKPVKILIHKRFAKLDHAVGSEVEIDDHVFIHNGTPWLPILLLHDHKRRQVLVAHVGVGLLEGRDGLRRTLKLVWRFTKNVGEPAACYNSPVSLRDSSRVFQFVGGRWHSVVTNKDVQWGAHPFYEYMHE